MWWQTGSKIRPKNIPWMSSAKEHVIVVLTKFKELVEANKLNREANNRYENNIISSLSNIKLNPRKCWSLSKSDMGCNSNRVRTLNNDSRIISDDVRKAENFNCYFAAHMTFSKNSYQLSTLPRLTYHTDDRLDIVTAKEFDVLKYL